MLPATSVCKKSDPATVDSSVVQSLQRQVREREKRIAELEAQLDTLKVIDQDMEKRRKSSRPALFGTVIFHLRLCRQV